MARYCVPVLRVLVTHMHPDHVGLAAWLCERWNAPLWMTMTDYAIARLWSQRAPDAGVQGGGAGGQGAVDHFARHGWRDAAAQEQIRQRRSEEHTSDLQSLMRSSYAV